MGGRHRHPHRPPRRRGLRRLAVIFQERPQRGTAHGPRCGAKPWSKTVEQNRGAKPWSKDVDVGKRVLSQCSRQESRSFFRGLRPREERRESGEKRRGMRARRAQPGVRRLLPFSHAVGGRAGCADPGSRTAGRGLGIGRVRFWWRCRWRGMHSDKPGGSSPRRRVPWTLTPNLSRVHPGAVDRMSFRGRGGPRAAEPRPPGVVGTECDRVA